MRSILPLFASALVAVVTVFATSEARADETKPATTEPAAGTPAPASAQDKPATQAGETSEPGRLRIGFDFFGGIGTGGSLSGPAFGARVRAGWQFNRLLGVYYQASPYVWVAGSGDAGVSVGAVVGVPNTVLASYSPVDIVEIAAGPSLDYLGGGSSSSTTNANGTTSTASAFGGAYFALHGRVGLHLGGRNEETGRRKGFLLAADVHPAFVEGEVLTQFTLGLGAEWF